MNNAEANFYQKLVKIAEQHDVVEPETATLVVEAPAVEPVKTEPLAKVASVTDMTIESMLEHPDFLKGVMDSLSRRNVEIESALQRLVLPE